MRQALYRTTRYGNMTMTAPRIIPEAVLRLQVEASDPAVSAWVAANAGAGKTHVLAQRVIRLLLDATALETPGGLKVQTIHAFCTRLLHQFPFEANVAARFEVLDEAAETQLLDQVSLGVLLDAALDPHGALGR